MGKKKSKGVLKGPKFNHRHHSYIELAKDLISKARDRQEVSKIVLGPITNARGGMPKVSARIVPAGMLVTVRSNCQVQKIYLYTCEPETTAKELDLELTN